MESALIRYEQLQAAQQRQVLDIRLLDEQKNRNGDIHGALHALTARPVADIQGYALLLEGVPRGFFLLKRRSLLPCWADGSTATLHALMIDHRYQGAGLGKRCIQALPGLVQGLWPGISQLMLAVDPDNYPARTLYRAQGWNECGEACQAASGVERRMVLDLPARACSA